MLGEHLVAVAAGIVGGVDRAVGGGAGVGEDECGRRTGRRRAHGRFDLAPSPRHDAGPGLLRQRLGVLADEDRLRHPVHHVAWTGRGVAVEGAVGEAIPFVLDGLRVPDVGLTGIGNVIAAAEFDPRGQGGAIDPGHDKRRPRPGRGGTQKGGDLAADDFGIGGARYAIDRVVGVGQRRFLHERCDRQPPPGAGRGVVSLRVTLRRRGRRQISGRKPPLGRHVAVEADGDLLEGVGAAGAPAGLAGSLNRRQKETDEPTDDRDHDEQFDERESEPGRQAPAFGPTSRQPHRTACQHGGPSLGIESVPQE